MSQPVTSLEDDAESRALAAAVVKAEVNPHRIPHERVRGWLLRLAAGERDATPPRAD